MAAELPQGKKELLPPASAAQQEGHLKVYHRCPKRHLRVLESKVARLVIRLNDELKEKVATLGLAQALPSCAGLLEEIEKTIAKRNAVYAAVEKEINEGDGNGDGAPPPPPPYAAM